MTVTPSRQTTVLLAAALVLVPLAACSETADSRATPSTSTSTASTSTSPPTSATTSTTTVPGRATRPPTW